MANTPWVVEVTMANFQHVVVEGSRERPVVLDFWAEWCGPCKRLAPLLESLAAEKNGEFLLGKVNTDENPDLAQAFQIEGIPAVFAIRDGKMVSHFTGLMPEEDLRKFLDGLGTATPPEPTPLELTLELEGRDPTAATVAYRAMLAAAPDDPAARVGLARMLLAAPGAESEAAALIADGEFGDFTDEAKRLNSVVQLRAAPYSDADLATARAAPGTGGKLALAKVLAARGEYAAALDALLAVAEDDQQLGRTTVRELMLKVLAVIGPQSDMASDYRRRLQALLY